MTQAGFYPPTLYNATEAAPQEQLALVKVQVDRCSGKYPSLDDDESYSLKIPTPEQSTKATIKAKSVWGALRGMETLSQLVYTTRAGALVIGSLPVDITDKPAYAHRGLMLDTSRNFFPVADIKRTLDAMSYNKLNVFHWHIVDAQSWPIESKFMPELYQKGAYSPSMTYSHREVKDIIQYARVRGIRVIPEFDMPGHVSVVNHVLPQIMTCVNEQPGWDAFAAEPPSGQFNPLLEDTYKFVKKIIDEYSGLFRDDYFHTGTDEVNTHCWETTQSIQQFLTANKKKAGELVDMFLGRAHKFLTDNKKLPMVWEEAILDFNATLSKEAVVQVWRSAENVQKVVAKGHKVLANSYEYWYLDCGHGTWLGNNPEGNSWCDPFKHWQRVYSYDPIANITSPAEQKLVIGGDVCLWAEQTDTNNLDNVLWPRAAAAAEVLWSGKEANGKPLTVKDALVRIQDQRFRLVARGIKAEPLQPLWCARNPGMCDLPPKAPE
ncbi:glycoside hydrolase superfamily [Dimargaris cristalligena]|uniref:Beta-hexosaminidase n=1 Tax=Dimargaris cristalligena TaxID=215637 RepID=A0A4P9ZSC1_9FUNG|nr:glycoside hydrolase superfamily [Dimargaris cristalligena]|eukprot:RKP35360.1 glycoside hydrolase superfamily [Dimargaris cristalligena]